MFTTARFTTPKHRAELTRKFPEAVALASSMREAGAGYGEITNQTGLSTTQLLTVLPSVARTLRTSRTIPEETRRLVARMRLAGSSVADIMDHFGISLGSVVSICAISVARQAPAFESRFYRGLSQLARDRLRPVAF